MKRSIIRVMRCILEQGDLKLIVGCLIIMNVLLCCICMCIGTCIPLRYKTDFDLSSIVFLHSHHKMTSSKPEVSEVLREFI